ncbi:uncharacterized mitochondrial protein AtMg00300-like [Henckelia pumila]|uniref:uncharacterized mitochondrial protein AtMg00300-like n=1 Tax=Henckelia pumila TaxID=405737 RepID=UPI003C6E767A
MKAIKDNALYIFKGDTNIVGGTTSVQTEDKTRLWHLRLGHVSERGLQEQSKQGLLGGDKIHTLKLCERSILGKAKRVSSSKEKHTTEHPLAYIHSDLWVPSRTETRGGGRYFMTIIDEYSRKVWTFVLKAKDEAYNKFKYWLQVVENKTDWRMKHLRTDNGL